MTFYMKKPLKINALQYRKDADIRGFLGSAFTMIGSTPGIKTLEGVTKLNPGEVILKGIEGEFWAVKPDFFKKTYKVLKKEPSGIMTVSKIPTKVQGIQFNGKNEDEVMGFSGDIYKRGHLYIRRKDGDLKIDPGSYVIKDASSTWCVKGYIFRKTYVKV